jgi:hypothetical protein
VFEGMEDLRGAVPRPLHGGAFTAGRLSVAEVEQRIGLVAAVVEVAEEPEGVREEVRRTPVVTEPRHG